MRLRHPIHAVLCLALLAITSASSAATDRDSTEAFLAMAEAGANYINNSTDCPGVISAPGLLELLSDYTVIDIRSQFHYELGHIPGAYHSSLGTLFEDLATNIPDDKSYLIACYTGQTAGHAKIAMELNGYRHVKSLLYGMSAWNSSLDSWSNNCHDYLAFPEAEDQNGNLTEHAFPVLEGDPDTIVAERVSQVLSEGFRGVSYLSIYDHLEEYFIINYFGPADYLGVGTSGVPGHIPGAYQFTPYASLGLDQMLNNIPADMPVVVYCWTGQLSSQLVFYLNTLGYEAYSLNFGVNSLFHSQLTAHVWSPAAMNDFPLEEGGASEAFQVMAAAGSAYINDSASCPGVISAINLFDYLEYYTVIDIRSQFHYEMGHIPGAWPSTLGTLIDDLANTIPSDKPYVLACYTGQTAGVAKIAMEMLGYNDVYSLLWGMSSWNQALDNWSNNCADYLVDPETEGQNDNLIEHDFPDLQGDPSTIVTERVTSMLTAGFRGVSYPSIQGNLEDYFIINYFGEADYLGQGSSGVPGHIPGAYQFTPYASLAIDQMLDNIPPDMSVVVYDWTGQHSVQVASYLNMLGYDAYSLKFGVNSLFHSDLTAHRWGPYALNDFPLEEGGVSAAPEIASAVVNGLGNHPNPFNPTTTISYQLNESARVKLEIYDLRGRLVTELVDGTEQEVGSYEWVWRGVDSSGRAVPSGAYIARLEAGNHIEGRRLMLIR